MKMKRKHMGLILVSFIALSFNSHFAQAAKKSQNIIQEQKVYAFKRNGQQVTPLQPVFPGPMMVKKFAVRLDRKNIFIGGYLVNTSKNKIQQVRIFPSFLKKPKNAEMLSDLLNHDELNISGGEIRRFVIMRPISDVKDLLEQNIPIEENCILNCRVM